MITIIFDDKVGDSNKETEDVFVSGLGSLAITMADPLAPAGVSAGWKGYPVVSMTVRNGADGQLTGGT